MTYYDVRGQRSSTRDPMGNLTEFGYDGWGRLITTTRTLGGVPVVTVNHYDVLGNRVGQTDALGNTTTYVYDELNRLVQMVSAGGVATTRGYNEVGWIITTTNDLGHQTVVDYDALGHRVATTDAEGNVTRHEYDGLSNQTAVIDANNVRTSYVYDGMNRLVGVIENDTGGAPTHDSNVLTQYLYDGLGNRIVVTNARNYTSTYTVYDTLNRPVIVEDALGNQTHTRYNALGYRTVVTDADGGSTRYSYDGLNRLVSIQYPDSSVQYAYDAVGNRTAVTDSVGVTAYVYDDLYRLVSVTDPITGTVGYGYDLAGNRTQLTYPDPSGGSGQGGKVVTYTYDVDYRLVQVEVWDRGVTSYNYDVVGRLITTTLPNGIVTVNQYDDANRLVNLTHTAADDTLLASYGYVLDGVGNRTQAVETLVEPVTTTMRVITYTYDPLNRLTSADYSTGENFEYTYDTVGNRTAMTTTEGSTTYTYDAANRLTSVDGVPYTWDTRGNLVNDGTFTYTYNGAGRMVRAQSVTATLVYTYNSDGLRVAQSVDSDVTTFMWDAALLLAQVLATSDGALDIYGLGRIGEVQGGTWAYPLGDSLSSVRQWADSAGAVTYAAGYTPYGEGLWHEGSATSARGYTGEWQDLNVGMVYLRARWYVPGTGRFTRRDPWSGTLADPLTLNPYVYALANPTNFSDPSGYQSESEKLYIRELYRRWIKDVADRLNVRSSTNLSDDAFATMIAARILVEDATIYADRQPAGIGRQVSTFPVTFLRPWARDLVEKAVFGDEISWGPANMRLPFVIQNLEWWEQHYSELGLDFKSVGTYYYEAREHNWFMRWLIGNEENQLEYELQTDAGTANQMALAILRTSWRVEEYYLKRHLTSEGCESIPELSAYIIAMGIINYFYSDDVIFELSNWKYQGVPWDWVEAMDDTANALNLHLIRGDHVTPGSYYDYLPYTEEEKDKLDTLQH